MSEREGEISREMKRRQSPINVINYLYERSVNGTRDDSSRFTSKLFDTAKDFYKKDLVAHFGCVNAIEFSADGNFLFSGGDDRRVLMWNMNDAAMYYTGKLERGAMPCIMKACHYSNIFCIAVDDQNKRVLSGSNDDQVIVHDFVTGSPVDVFLHDSPVFSLSLYPANGNIFASAADNGRIVVYDIRESNTDLFCVAKLRTPFHGVMFNPMEPSLLATANSKAGIHIWDLRKPREILNKCNDEPSMAVRWSQDGRTLLALRNLLPIVLYDPPRKKKLEFDSGTYFNACTMKSCCFAGSNDEYILSGSDDFNLYMWKIPDPWPDSRWVGSEHLILPGHRSIVNQVRFTAPKQLIATSGVEKIIKLWSPFRLPYSEGDHDTSSPKRHRILCSARSCTRSPGFLSHDYSQESVEEDSRMIHFFDTLLQNELDDVPDSFYLESNLFTLSRKKETRLYEKLIRKKKKYLSKLLIEDSGEESVHCSIKEGVPAGDNWETQSDLAQGRGLTDANRPALQSPGESNSSSVGLPGNSDGDFSLTRSSRSEMNLESDSRQGASESRTTKSSILVKLKLRDSAENQLRNAASDTSDSDQSQSCTFFKRKRNLASRCYRNRSRRKTCSDDSESSEPDPCNEKQKATGATPASSEGTELTVTSNSSGSRKKRKCRNDDVNNGDS